MQEISKEFLKKKGLIHPVRRIPYNPKLKNRAREMRKNMTKAEKKIWFDFLKDWKYRTLKQRPIDNYIVDFYIPELKLVIEVDGETHYEKGALEYDRERTEILEGYDLKVLRFTNLEIFENFSGVCEVLESIFFNFLDKK